MTSDTTAAVGVGLMVSGPVGHAARVPFVQVVLYEAPSWAFTIGDVAFVIGSILALTKLIQLLKPSGCGVCRNDRGGNRDQHGGG